MAFSRPVFFKPVFKPFITVPAFTSARDAEATASTGVHEFHCSQVMVEPTRGGTPVRLRDAKAMASADVKECRDSYVIVVDISGFNSGGIKVEVENDNVLIISGERKVGEGGPVMYRRMCDPRVSEFVRKFTMPKDFNFDDISAVIIENSIQAELRVTIPKLSPGERRKPRSIKVEVRKR